MSVTSQAAEKHAVGQATAASDALGSLALPVGIVVIGRNEGDRLVACLASLPDDLPVVYVDSGSTDGSPEAALAANAELVRLDMSLPFSAARARNEGFAQLKRIAPNIEAVQFLDGDTVLREGWLEAATGFLAENPKAVAVAGRRRERHPDRSVYNAFCDDEWDRPPGECTEIGGDSLIRTNAFEAAGGFRPDVIAGEEPELCLRLRAEGGTVHRLPDEMTWHDAAITTFGANWRRAERSGYAYALGALMHGRQGFRLRETVRIVFWGATLPAFAILFLVTPAWPVTLLILALYVLKFLRLRARFADRRHPGRFAGLLIVNTFAEFLGMLRFAIDTMIGTRKILEYK